MEKAVILLSGGIDSATTLGVAVEEGYAAHCLTFRYGQRHSHEIEAARKIAGKMGVADHLVVDLDLRAIGHSALTDQIPVPKHREPGELSRSIPVTYVPARNTIFLSYALAWAEVLEAGHIFIGVNAVDYSGYPDCRPGFIAAFAAMANLALKLTVEGRLRISIDTPLINLTKAEIVRLGTRLGIDYSLTHSCYDPLPDGTACGACDSCVLRRRGFREAGIPDPTRYAG